ncbi:MAG: MBL fold metallo-hydrolase, partial [Gammaproteobacteria bacterium]|nr:MBL fold metallo-hydrolase [Gammaproteobacteria bacterium]
AASDGIQVVDTHYVKPLFDAAHLVVQDGRAAFVDCGTAHAVPRLLAALEAQGLGADAVDWLLLTHVHLDHAGGAGQLLQALPRARVAVHPRGAPHLVDPRKLIDASIAVYGEEAYRRLYGELLPIDASRVEATADGARLALGSRVIEVLHTPGHALHHQAFLDHAAQAVFTGDTFGLAYGALAVDGRPFAVPTTSPTQFDPEQLLASIARVAACGARTACLTHYGRIGELPRVALDLARMVRRFTDAALAHAARPAAEARAAIRDDLRAIVLEEWRRLGATGPEALLDEWAGLDFDLNADGLMAWLARRAR